MCADELPVPVVAHGVDGVVVYANERLAALAGASAPASILGRPVEAVRDLLGEVARSTAELDGRPVVLLVGDGRPSTADRTEAWYQALVRNSTDMVVVHRDGVFRYASPSVERILGWSSDDLVGNPVTMIVHDDDVERLRRRVADRQRGVVSPGPGRYRMLQKHGGFRWVETISTVHLDDPIVAGIVVNARDVTATVEAEEQLRLSEERHRALIEHLSDVIIVTDAQGTIVFVSPAITALLGFDADVVRGSTIFDGLHPDDAARGRSRLEQAVAGGPGSYGPDRFRYLHVDGEWRHLEVTASNRLGDRSVGGLIFVVRDVTPQHEAEELLRHLALHDALTGLANRTLLREKLAAALAAGRRDGTVTALLVVDCDRFKAVNDQLGHEAGDAVLVELAQRMGTATRDVDTVARLGGDEFAIVLPGVATIDEAVATAERVAEAVGAPIVLPSVTVAVGASIGLAVAPEDAGDAEALLRLADATMFRAKAAGGGVAVHGDRRSPVSGDTPG